VSRIHNRAIEKMEKWLKTWYKMIQKLWYTISNRSIAIKQVMDCRDDKPANLLFI
jgi:hypothetical protein